MGKSRVRERLWCNIFLYSELENSGYLLAPRRQNNPLSCKVAIAVCSKETQKATWSAAVTIAGTADRISSCQTLTFSWLRWHHPSLVFLLPLPNSYPTEGPLSLSTTKMIEAKRSVCHWCKWCVPLLPIKEETLDGWLNIGKGAETAWEDCFDSWVLNTGYSACTFYRIEAGVLSSGKV